MAKFNDIIENKEYRERVIKLFNLPIRLSVSKDKFLSDLDFLRVTDETRYKTIVYLVEHDFNVLAKEQETDAPDFSMETRIAPLIEKIEGSNKWQEFTRRDYSGVLANFAGVRTPHGFYQKKNDGKHFLSIDLISANWQSLQRVLNMDKSYEEVIEEYTEGLLIPKQSKAIRTKITGMLDVKQIGLLNQKILEDNKDNILEIVNRETGVDLRERELTAFYADEFIIEITAEEKKMMEKDIEDKILNETGVGIHFRTFSLHWLMDKAYVKKNGEKEIINISKDVLLLFNKVRLGYKPAEVDFENIKNKDECLSKIKEAIERYNAI